MRSSKKETMLVLFQKQKRRKNERTKEKYKQQRLQPLIPSCLEVQKQKQAKTKEKHKAMAPTSNFKLS